MLEAILSIKTIVRRHYLPPSFADIKSPWLMRYHHPPSILEQRINAELDLGKVPLNAKRPLPPSLVKEWREA
jgi:hypothetical protein